MTPDERHAEHMAILNTQNGLLAEANMLRRVEMVLMCLVNLSDTRLGQVRKNGVDGTTIQMFASMESQIASFFP